MNLSVDHLTSDRTAANCSTTPATSTRKNNKLCSTTQDIPKQSRRKYQIPNRSSSLPALSSDFPNQNIDNQKRRVRQGHWNFSTDNESSLSHVNFDDGFLLNIGNRSLDSDFAKSFQNSMKSNDALLSSSTSSTNFNDKYETVDISAIEPIMSRPSISSSSSSSSLKFFNENSSIFDPANVDIDDVIKSINLLLERVESLNDYPSNKGNLLDFLNNLLNKFVDVEFDPTSTMIDDCSTLVQSSSLNSSNLSENDDRTEKLLTLPQSPDDSWLVVDFIDKPDSDSSHCLLPSSSSLVDDPCLLPTESYFSFEEIKSCGSESSHSNYFSPNSSLVDLQTMLPEFDEISNINSNNNNNNETELLAHDDGTSTIDLNHRRTTQQLQQAQQTSNNVNVIIETTNPNKLSPRLINEKSSNDETVQSSSSMKSELVDTTNSTIQDRKSRREKKIQERWTVNVKSDQQNGSNHEGSSNKAFLGVEFPPIAVLRRKFSSMPSSSAQTSNSTIKRKDQTNQLSNKPSISEQVKDVSTRIDRNQETSNQDQLDLTGIKEQSQTSSHDVSSLINNVNDVQEICRFTTIYKEKIDDQEITKKVDVTSNENDSSASVDKNFIDRHDDSQLELISPSLSSSPVLLTSSSLSTTSIDDCRCSSATDDHTTEQATEHSDENIINVEKKNNCNGKFRTNATGIVLTHTESIDDDVAAIEREKKEEQELLLLLVEQQTRQNNEQASTEKEYLSDLLFAGNSDNHRQIPTMAEPDVNQTCYTKIELEELPDDEELLSEQAKQHIEPVDFILTDEEQKKHSTSINEDRRVPSKVFADKPPLVPSSTSQRPEDDPIAQRALQRFEQRMNAAVNSRASSVDGKSVPTKGKSSWSGSMTMPRKSVENLFKSRTNSIENDETMSTSQNESFIRPRRTFLDDSQLNLLMQPVSSENVSTKQHQTEDQQIPTDIIDENNNKPPSNESTEMFDTTDDANRSELNKMNTETSMTSENGLENGAETSMSATTTTTTNDNSINTVISVPSTVNDQTVLTPYRHHIEGRRRLNTVDRIRERHQSVDSSMNLQHNSSLQNQYSMKNEDVQDPIIRRALERFDEQNRVLQQLKPSTFEDVQDPITRRALMRLETNLKRTMPQSSTNQTRNFYEPDADNNWSNMTNNYTMTTSQMNPEQRFSRMSDAALPPPIPNHRSHFSTHQRYPTASNGYINDYSNGQAMPTDDHRWSAFRNNPQSMLTGSNHPTQIPIHFRQRSRSEDPLSSKELSIGLTSDLNHVSTEENQRNQTANEIIQTMEVDASASHKNLINPNENNSSSITDALQTCSMSDQAQTNEEFIDDVIPIQSENQFSTEYQYAQMDQSNQYSRNPSAFVPVHPSSTNYYSQQTLPTNSYSSMYSSNNLQQTPYSDDPIIRRALERFNCQMQQSMMTNSQHQVLSNAPSNTLYGSRTLNNGNHHLNGTDSYYGNDLNGHDTWTNSYHTMPRGSHLNGNSGAPGTGSGYQSIIGRRRQMRQDDAYFDSTSVGNGYSSSLFLNNPNPPNHSQRYLMMADEPSPSGPMSMTLPRYTRENFLEQADYMCENVNNNNNSTNPIHHQNYVHSGNSVYPQVTNGFRPINQAYPSTDAYHQFQDDDYLRHRAQSTSSTGSSDSMNPIRLIHQRLPSNVNRNNVSNNKSFATDQCQMTTGQTSSNLINGSGDSVFQRLAYTGTKSSLSKSSSNLCANLLNKGVINTNPTSNLKTHEIDLDEANDQSPIENHQETIESNNASSKSLRSRSVDARARLKSSQTRLINGSARPSNDYEEPQTTSNIPSSRFTSATTRRETQPVPSRPPITPRTNLNERAPTRRTASSHTLNFNRQNSLNRTRTSNGNLIDHDNSLSNELDRDEHSNTVNNEQYHQAKIIENRTRLPISTNRSHVNGSHLQSSASTSSVANSLSRSKLSSQLETREINPSGSELNRNPKRSDEHRLLSPGVQRRPIPVSVFSPAKSEIKRPAPAPPKSTSPVDESTRMSIDETNKCSSTSSSSEITTATDEPNDNRKLNSIPPMLKSSTGNLLKDFSLSTDPNGANKKMNVFERLFRGHKKKI